MTASQLKTEGSENLRKVAIGKALATTRTNFGLDYL